MIYQVVWQRVLTSYYGVGAVSCAMIVGVYMAGLGIGGLLGGYLAERFRSALALLFVVDGAVGIFGCVSLRLLDFIGERTVAASHAVSAIAMFGFLCVPTCLKGPTLPLLTRVFGGRAGGLLHTVGSLNFLNTLGAAAGALIASYLLISFFGLGVAVQIARGINLALAALIARAWRLDRASLAVATVGIDDTTPAKPGEFGHWTLPVVFLAGFVAIGYKLVWFRIIGVMVKDTPYAISTTLAVYLLEVALGSLAIDRVLTHRPTKGCPVDTERTPFSEYYLGLRLKSVLRRLP